MVATPIFPPEVVRRLRLGARGLWGKGIKGFEGYRVRGLGDQGIRGLGVMWLGLC